MSWPKTNTPFTIHNSKLSLLFCCLFLLGIQPQLKAQSSAEVLEFQLIAGDLSEASAIDMAVEEGRLFVLEAGRHRLLEFDAAGQRRDSLGGRGDGDYQFRDPSTLDATNGLRLYIADSGNGRVQLFERRLSHIAGIKPEEEDFFTPRLLAVSPFGEVFVYDENRHRLLLFDSGGRMRDEFRLSFYDELRRPVRIQSMSLLGDELLLLARDGDDKTIIHRLGTGGRYNGFFGQDEGIQAITASGNFLRAATSGDILRYDAAGRLLERVAYRLPETAAAESELRGIAVNRSVIYLLTSEKLYRAEGR
jgi:hypothetical protein